MRLADVFQSFPSIVLVLCLVSLVGPSALNLVLVLGLLGWSARPAGVRQYPLGPGEGVRAGGPRPGGADGADSAA